LPIYRKSLAGVVVLFLALSLSFSLSYGQEQEKAPVLGSQRPLSEILNPDGTLKVGPGVQGAFDPKGFRMVSGADGQPKFLPSGDKFPASGEISPAAPGDDYWYPQFNQSWTIVVGTVYAIAISGTDVYVGGDITQVGGSPVNHLAKWNGTGWSGVSAGVNGTVYALAISGTDVYVGGAFTSPANHIARFDTTNGFWLSTGGGVDGSVYALAASGTDVYVGGYFSTAGTNPASNIAKWNGSTWSALGSGTNSGVLAIAASGTDVYAGGDFTQAGVYMANHVAKWNGTAWSLMGSGLNAFVDAIAVSATDVYVGGNFTTAGGNPANYIAKWNGTSWSALGSGLDFHFWSIGGSAIAAKGMDIYVGGQFLHAGGIPANYIAKWDGTSWSALGSGLDNMVSAIATSGREVYVGGQFVNAGGKQSWNFARWFEPLAVVSPNGGETWDAGSSHSITWATAASVGPVKIEYSTNNGSNWTTVIASTPNTGSYSWTVPNTPSASCFVRISDAATGSPSDSSDRTFTISGLRVTSPNGGEQLIVGSQHLITWDTAGTMPTVRLELSTNNGATWETITASTTNTGSYLWTVTSTISSQCLVRISDSADGVPSDTSDAVFSTVAVPFIQVTRPNGGEVLEPGASDYIYWNAQAYTGSVKIEFSTNNGSTWMNLLTEGINSGIYPWTVPNMSSASCLVRISELPAGQPTDTSDGTFTIVGFHVTAPQGVQWAPGSSQTITWETFGSYPTVRLEFSPDNGATWETISASTANTGSYPWTVPNVTATQARIRVSDSTDGIPFAEGWFSIVVPPPPPSIWVISPNGGESWLVGSSHDITWGTSGNVGALMTIMYSTNNGASFSMIAFRTPNDGSYTWTVPNTVSSQCLVRVSDANLIRSDTSNAVFLIVATQTITVTSPNGGETWAAGSSHDITWTQGGLDGSVTIDLYEGGVLVKTLGTANATAGTFTWIIGPAENIGKDYRVRVWQGTVLDESDADFTIQRAVRVDFNKDGQEDILWRYQGSGVAQGWDVAWLMHQGGTLMSAKSAVKAVANVDQMTGSSPVSTYIDPIVGENRGDAVSAGRSDTPLERGNAKTLRPTASLRNPSDGQALPMRKGGRANGDKNSENTVPFKGTATANPLSSGTMETASLGSYDLAFLSNVLDTGWELVGTGDFNGDGNTDTLWRYYGGGYYQGWNLIWYMEGTTIKSYGFLPTVADTNWRIAGTGDIDGDGNLEILWRYYGSGDTHGWNVVWHMNGETIGGYGFLTAVTDLNWKIDGVGDFNGDGKADILWRYYGSGDTQGWNVIWYMNGESIGSYGFPTAVTDLNWRVDGTGDFDVDGKADLLWRYYGTGYYQGWNILWYMNDAVIKAQEQLTTVTDTNWRIVNR
jgi:hypothetical protein